MAADGQLGKHAVPFHRVPTVYLPTSYWILTNRPLILCVRDSVVGSLYFYAPNAGAAIFGIIAFAISTATHAWQCM
jgi:hypothetical protein